MKWKKLRFQKIIIFDLNQYFFLLTKNKRTVKIRRM